MPPSLSERLLTTQVIADRAIATLYDTLVMAQLCHRDYERYFVPGVGNKVTIRKPATFVAKEFNRAVGIELQEPEEGSTDVTLNHFADVSFPVTAEDWALEIENFDEQLLTPAMEAVAQKVDADILKLRDDLDDPIGTAASWGNIPGEGYPVNDWRVLIEAGTELTTRNVPSQNRHAVVDPRIAGAWVASPTWHEADKRGSTEGLTEAALGGRVAGFSPWQHTGIKDGQGMAFHRDALALVCRPMPLPAGAKSGALSSYKGLGLRVVYDYDIKKKQDIVSIDMLYGTKMLEPERAVLLGAATPVTP